VDLAASVVSEKSIRTSQRQEAALVQEQAEHGDIVRVDVIDEYSNSAQKMKAFIRATQTYSSSWPAATAPSGGRRHQFQYMLKLDDDNVCDLGRIVCSLVALSPTTAPASAKLACKAAGLDAVQRPFEIPAAEKRYQAEHAFWWSSFRQKDIQSKYRHGAYFISPEVAAERGSHSQCVREVWKGKESGASAEFEPAVHPAAPGRLFEAYGYGGSHLLSGNVVRWWAADGERMNTDVWMEDVSFGVWFAAFSRAHQRSDGSSTVGTWMIHDDRWQSDIAHACLNGSLAMNAG